MSPRPVPTCDCRPLTAYRPQRKHSHVANIKSQLKRIKTNRLATERNKAIKSEFKTAIRKFRDAADSGNADEAKAALAVEQEVLDGQEGRRSLTVRDPDGARHRLR